jgi:RNA polymerase sigma-70 factor (ECF subfamily)
MAPNAGRSMAAAALSREERAGVDSEPLVQRARQGDLRAFEALLELRLTGLLRLALAILGDEVDARDALQEACVKAWRELPRLREAARFDAWLRRILTNECRSALRSRRRRRVREIAVSYIDPAGDVELAAPAGPDHAERTAQLDVLERAFERLDAGARTLLALHHLEGRSVAEISAELGLTNTTVKWRLHRARAALNAALLVERR